MQDDRRFRFVSFTFFVGFGVGCFVGVALALLAIALVQRSDASDTGTRQLFVIPTVEPTPLGATATPDGRPRTKVVQDVRVGPGFAFAIVGTLQRGEAVEVIGRDADASWLAIQFPAGSLGRGWVPVNEMQGVGEIEELAVSVATPLPRTIAAVPPATSNFGGVTSPPVVRPPSTLPLPGDDRLPQAPAPRINAGPPDLVVNRVTLLNDGRVRVVVGNIGPGDVVDQHVNVTIRDLNGSSELLIANQRGLEAGETISLTSSHFLVRSETQVTAIADPAGNLFDQSRSNNVVTLVLTPPPPATPPPSGRNRNDEND